MAQTPQTRVVFARGGIGWLSFIIWLIIYGLTMAIPGFAIPSAVMGVWLVITAIAMAVGV